MKKVILSAFAMSLIALSSELYAQTEAVDDFLGLETEILPDLKGKQRFTSENFHSLESWNVPERKAIVDLPRPNKGQGYSIIPWAELEASEWLSIDRWLLERSVKDVTPDWKIRMRQSSHQELFGKVLQCRGTCHVYRGSEKASVQYLSRIYEGDELRTLKDSVAWIYLMDGSLIRVASDSSVSFLEINFGSKEVFVVGRLNQGHVFWHPRLKGTVVTDSAPETDSMMLPLQVREANEEFFRRKNFQAQTDEGHLGEIFLLDENALADQYRALRERMSENSAVITIPTRAMLISPAATLVAKEVDLDLAFVPGGKTYFKKRSSAQGEDCIALLRGYRATESNPIGDNSWYEVESNGRSLKRAEDVPGPVQILELLTKRIKSIELAREIWVRDFSVPIFRTLAAPKALALEHGYTLWSDGHEKRLEFLLEYTRRIETTNLRSMENLLTKIEGAGQKVYREPTEELYRASLNHYLLGLKSRYDKKKMRVREMNDLQYYVWILRNGKF